MTTITSTAPGRPTWTAAVIAVLAAAVVALTVTLIVTLTGNGNNSSNAAPAHNHAPTTSSDPCHQQLRGAC